MSETLVEIGFDMAELEPDYTYPPPECPSDATTPVIIRAWTRESDDPPPPPLTPHPRVLELLAVLSVPDNKMTFSTKPRTIPLELVAGLTDTNRKEISRMLQQLSDEATTCKDAAQFRNVVSLHVSRINHLVSINRKRAEAHCKKENLPKQVVQASKFGFFKRISVWRDAVKEVQKLAQRNDSWTEDRRNFLWRRLICTNQFSWYGYNLAETFSLSSYYEQQVVQ